MTTPQGSERKGRFFKAAPAAAARSAGQRSEVIPARPATKHAPTPAPPPPPGPTGEAGAPDRTDATVGDPEAAESILGRLAGADAPGRGGADSRGGNDVTKLTELLFNRSVFSNSVRKQIHFNSFHIILSCSIQNASVIITIIIWVATPNPGVNRFESTT